MMAILFFPKGWSPISMRKCQHYNDKWMCVTILILHNTSHGLFAINHRSLSSELWKINTKININMNWLNSWKKYFKVVVILKLTAFRGYCSTSFKCMLSLLLFTSSSQYLIIRFLLPNCLFNSDFSCLFTFRVFQFW
jgi:hypothetical protein